MSEEVDERRKIVLEIFYRAFKDGRNEYFKHLNSIEARRRVNDEMSSSELDEHILYLKDVGLLKSKKIKGHTLTKYLISSKGIKLFEGESVFQKTSTPFPNLHIENVGGIVQVGNHNFAQSKYREISNDIEELKELIGSRASLGQEERIEIQADLNTIQSQLVKRIPDKSIMSMIWDKLHLGKIADTPQLVGIVERVSQFIGNNGNL